MQFIVENHAITMLFVEIPISFECLNYRALSFQWNIHLEKLFFALHASASLWIKWKLSALSFQQISISLNEAFELLFTRVFFLINFNPNAILMWDFESLNVLCLELNMMWYQSLLVSKKENTMIFFEKCGQMSLKIAVKLQDVVVIFINKLVEHSSK